MLLGVLSAVSPHRGDFVQQFPRRSVSQEVPRGWQ